MKNSWMVSVRMTARRWKSASTLPVVATQGFGEGGLVRAAGCGESRPRMKTTNKRMDGAQFVIVKNSWMVSMRMMALRWKSVSTLPAVATQGFGVSNSKYEIGIEANRRARAALLVSLWRKGRLGVFSKVGKCCCLESKTATVRFPSGCRSLRLQECG